MKSSHILGHIILFENNFQQYSPTHQVPVNNGHFFGTLMWSFYNRIKYC